MESPPSSAKRIADVGPMRYLTLSLDPVSADVLHEESRARAMSKSTLVRALLRALRAGRVML